MRAIYRFGKARRLMCMSHLDLQRFMQMALRRTQLPVAYSQGFNPHPLLSFASALAMGWTSECELMDIKMDKPIDEAFAFEQMRAALPPDLPLHAVRLVDDRHPALMARLNMADYRVSIAGEGVDEVAAALPGYLAEREVIALRKTKSGEKPTDIRPMSVFVESHRTEIGHDFSMRLMLTERATLKPDLLLRVLSERAGVEPPAARIHRTALLAADAQGRPVAQFSLEGVDGA